MKQQMATIKVYSGSNCGAHDVVKGASEYINTNGSHWQKKVIWTADDGTEWTKVAGEWRNVVTITSHRDNTIIGKGIGYSRAYAC